MKWGTVSSGEKKSHLSNPAGCFAYLPRWKKVGDLPSVTALVNLSPALPVQRTRVLNLGQGMVLSGLECSSCSLPGLREWALPFQRLRRHLCEGSLCATCVLRCLTWGLHLPLTFSFYNGVSKENFTVCAGCLTPLFHHHQNHRLPFHYPLFAYKTHS